MREGIEKKVKKCGGMASVRKLAESSQEAVVVTPPTIIPPLASSVANEANTTSGDVAFEVFVEALAFVVLPSSITSCLLLSETRLLLLLVIMLIWGHSMTYI